MERLVNRYFSALSTLAQEVEVTDRKGQAVAFAEAVSRVVVLMRDIRAGKRKIMFVGNGGSASIASHMAIDFTKNGRVPALAFNDSAALTCLANDMGYENVFAHQIDAHGKPGDLLVAISSSGQSPNIVAAVGAAQRLGCAVVTFSGFAPDNPLRRLGDLNLYVPSDQYGFVEITHLTLLHATLDLAIGWDGAVRTDRAAALAGR